MTVVLKVPRVPRVLVPLVLGAMLVCATGASAQTTAPADQSPAGPLLVEKIESERFVFLSQRAIAHHVGEHDGSQPSALLCFFGHNFSCASKQIIATPTFIATPNI